MCFNRDKAMHAISWIARNCTITEDGIGTTDGQRLRLEPWQQAFLWILFGWQREDGTRRFRYVYAELARGNGKSKLASAIALYVLHGEGAKGAAVYSVATKKEQAKFVWNDAALMVKNAPTEELAQLKVYREAIHLPNTATTFQPLASEEKSLDGLKPNLIVIDEFHQLVKRELWNVCKTALGKKPGSFILEITTAGANRYSVCYEQRTYCENVLNGTIEDDSYLPWICALDPEDDPFDPLNWPKSNPNLGVSVEYSAIEEAAKQAQLIPSEYNAFLRFRCNIWTEGATRWMNMEKWSECAEEVNVTVLRGRPCFGGLDLANSNDIAALVLLFPPFGEDKKWRVIPRYYLPKDRIAERSRRDQVPYESWSRQGLFTLTPGDIIDHDYIRKDINDYLDTFDVREIGYDPWNATQFVTQLTGDGFVMVPVRQGFPTMNSPTKMLLELICRGELAHGGNPILTWMAGNTVVDMDATGLIRPDKEQSTEKIDGIVALIIALARASVVPIKSQYVEWNGF
jgi:phage terminase large subunit-like protein